MSFREIPSNSKKPLLATAAIVLLMTSCGSSSKPATTTTSSTSSTSSTSTTSSTTSTSTSALAAAPAGWTLNANGLAGAKPGQTIDQVSKALGHPVTFADPLKCGGAIQGVSGINLYFKGDGHLWAIDTSPGSALATDKGIKPGSTEAEVKAAYPKAELQQTSYGSMYVVTDATTKNELLIKAGDGKVGSLLAGLAGVRQQDEFCG